MYEKRKYSHNNCKGEIDLTTQEYFRFLTEHLMKRMSRQDNTEINVSANYMQKNRLQEWFGLFPLSLKIWYKDR